MYQVFADSAANLPAEVAKKYGIHILSFVNYVNGEPLVCYDENLSQEEERIAGKRYYDQIRQGAEVRTALVNQGDFLDAFTPVLEAGEDILYFSLSKNISGTYNAARLAAEDLMEEYPDRKICLVDSLNASLAQGMLAIYATMMREKGVSVEEAARILTDTVKGMNGLFTVEDLKYLAKTGRVSGGTAFIGNALQIKPILRGSAEGFIVQFRKCKGRRKSLDTIVDLVCNNIVEPEHQFFGIAHADAYEESLAVVEAIKKRVPLKEVINTSYDYCTGSHVGPGCIAVFFIAGDRELMGKPADYQPFEVFKYID